MTNNENDLPKEDTTALDGLPESERKETQEIIDEIDAAEKKDVETPPKPEGDKPKEGETPKPEDKPADGEKPKEEAAKKPDEEPPRKSAKLMPSWVHEAAKKDWDKEKETLEKAIADLKANPQGGKQEDKPATEEKPVPQVTVDKIETVAKKHGLSADVVKDILELARENQGTLPQEIQEKLKNLDTITEEREIQAEEQAFSSNFDKFVIPLIKAEYGDTVEAATIQEIKDLLKAKAYTNEYKETPYSVLYKGIDDFRAFTRPKGGAEGSRGGAQNAHDADKGGAGGDQSFNGKAFKDLTDEDMKSMPGDVFDRYTTWAEANEKAKQR